MPADQAQQLGGLGLVTRETRDPVGDFMSRLAEDRTRAFDLEDLGHPRPIQIAVQRRGARKRAGFDPAVALVATRSRLLFFGFQPAVTR